jgi:hypothetical protein
LHRWRAKAIRDVAPLQHHLLRIADVRGALDAFPHPAEIPDFPGFPSEAQPPAANPHAEVSS